MIPVEIANALSIPEETETVEFKRLDGTKVVRKVLQTIVAMTNTNGGTVILGIDDPEKTTESGLGRVYGIEENIDVYDAIGQELRNIQPALAITWQPDLIEASNGRRVAFLEVPKATEYLHQYEGKAYIRAQKSNKQLSAHESIAYAYTKGFRHADTELVNVDLTLLKTPLYDAWARKRGLQDREQGDAMLATGLARRDEQGTLQPTRAAVMLFAEFPSHLMQTKCAIRVLVYSGTIEHYSATPNLIMSPLTLDGPVVTLIERAHETILNLLRTGVRVPSGFVNTYKIPERAIKEAITNAVIHRDYYTKRDIEVRIFEDRVEVESPGLLPFNITPANIGRVRSLGYRNDQLVKHLREFPNPPNLDQNEGVRAMRSVMQNDNLYPPIFWTYPYIKDAVRVVLFNEQQPSEWEKLHDYLLHQRYITNPVARQVTGIVQKTDMSKRLRQWVDQGLLIRVPQNPNVRRDVKYRLADRDEAEIISEAPENKLEKQTVTDRKGNT